MTDGRVDRFMADLGIARVDDVDAVGEAMEDEAFDFLASGGVLAWSDWLAMHPVTREAFRRASARWQVTISNPALVRASVSSEEEIMDEAAQAVADAAARQIAGRATR